MSNGINHQFQQFVILVPPLWFVGLNEIMIGSKDILFSAHPTLMGHYLYFIGFNILVYSAIFLIRRWQKSVKRRFEFIFEEEPELVMTSFDFSE